MHSCCAYVEGTQWLWWPVLGLAGTFDLLNVSPQAQPGGQWWQDIGWGSQRTGRIMVGPGAVRLRTCGITISGVLAESLHPLVQLGHLCALCLTRVSFSQLLSLRPRSSQVSPGAPYSGFSLCHLIPLPPRVVEPLLFVESLGTLNFPLSLTCWLGVLTRHGIDKSLNVPSVHEVSSRRWTLSREMAACSIRELATCAMNLSCHTLRADRLRGRMVADDHRLPVREPSGQAASSALLSACSRLNSLES